MVMDKNQIDFGFGNQFDSASFHSDMNYIKKKMVNKLTINNLVIAFLWGRQ